MNSRKVELGQFYTRANPFTHPRFQRWLTEIPKLERRKFIEPFGGSNSIVRMLIDSYPMVKEENWTSFDVHPEAQQENLVPKVPLSERDTIANYPMGFDVCVTNPPYLAKNSATRKGLVVDFGAYQDLFEVALDRMLEFTPYVAAIIPESFITRGIFRERLEFVISLNFEMFDDTEFPVCLAVFSPTPSAKFEIWRDQDIVAVLPDLEEELSNFFGKSANFKFEFNNPAGVLGLKAIDDTKSPSIKFVLGSDIAAENIKPTSRSLTRISGPAFEVHNLDLSKLVPVANQVLHEYRMLTNDVFLTSFKGLRTDGNYRRRLDWGTASKILNLAIMRSFPNLEEETLF